MRPVGDLRLMRYQAAQMVAAELTGISDAHVDNLLSLTDDERVEGFAAPGSTCWDDSTGGGGYGGSRRMSLVPAPFTAA